jgi:hypothetical protein
MSNYWVVWQKKRGGITTPSLKKSLILPTNHKRLIGLKSCFIQMISNCETECLVFFCAKCKISFKLCPQFQGENPMSCN